MEENNLNKNKNTAVTSCFSQPFLDFHHMQAWNREVPDLFRRAEESGDDRSLALITALLLEYHIDRLLHAFLPRYQILLDRSETTFSLKADMLKALAFVPPEILRCVDVLRKIRNDFAHDLNMEDFEKISKGRKVVLKQLNQYFTKEYDNTSSAKKDFKRIAYIAIIQLRMYEPNVKILREKIQDPDFISELGNAAFSRLQELFAELADKTDNSASKTTP